MGGMGEIFLARLEGVAGFEKLYVVKRILPHLANDVRFRQLLISEAQIAAKMSHANICQVYELGETAGQLYIVMEYLEGITVLPMMRRASRAGTPLHLGLVAGVIQQTCDALHYAHDLADRDGTPLGLVHRDITPANVFLTDSGVAKVLDFGIAKAKGSPSTKTEDGAVKGKYAYMAPEQLRGGAIDRRVDLFALGVVMYEMLALRRLFQRSTDYLTFRAVMEQPIPDIRHYRPDVPDGLVRVLEHALEREPVQRFENARQFGAAILDGLAGAQRPWSQGELSDYVRTNFADDIAKRGQQVQAAAAPRTTGQRTTIPQITSSEPAHESDDDDGFPSVETDVDDAPRFIPTPVPEPPRANPDPFQHTTPPPFSSGDSHASGPGLRPLHGETLIVRPRAQRSMLWPALAIAMVAITAGALILVWKQSRQQTPPVINLTQEHDDRAAPPVASTPPPPSPPPEPPSPLLADGSASGSGVAQPVHALLKRFSSYDAALAAQKPAMVQCLVDHRDGGIPNDGIIAVIDIAASGRAKSVQLKPLSLDAAPLGFCIRNVLMWTGFPTAANDNTITVPLKAKVQAVFRLT